MVKISNQSSSRYLYTGILVFLMMGIAITWANYRFAVQNPGGTDFLIHWVGSRSFIFKGQSPYSDASALEIQTMVYRGPAEQGQQELRVVYPLYSGILFFLFALIGDYTLARALWMTLLEISMVVIALGSLRISGWQPKNWLVALYLLFAIFWYHGLQALIDGNPVIVVTLLILWAFWAIRNQRDVVAGFALAFATIKPHLVLLLIGFVAVWAFSHRRWALIGWIFGWFSFFVLLGMFFIPDWILQNTWEILEIFNNGLTLSLGKSFEVWWPGIGSQLKWALAFLLAVITFFEWRAAWGKGFNHFLWTTSLTLTISQWIVIAPEPGNIVLLFFPFVLIFSKIKERWWKAGDWVVLGVMVLLFVGLWALFLNIMTNSNQPQQNLIMFFPMPLLVLIGLYWVRWWVIRPTRPILDG